MWHISQRPAQGHHPLSQCLPLTLNLDPQVVLRLRGVTEARRRQAGPMTVPLQSPGLCPQNLLPASQSNITCHVPPASLARAATSSLGASQTCDDRNRAFSGSDPRDLFIQWQMKVERRNRVQPTLQTLSDCVHSSKELAQTQDCLELPLLQQAHLAMTATLFLLPKCWVSYKHLKTSLSAWGKRTLPVLSWDNPQGGHDGTDRH